MDRERIDASGTIHWPTSGALILGALGSSALVAFVGGGWKQEALGYVAWALMPYAALAGMLLGARLHHLDRPVRLASSWASAVIALGGPLLYVDVLFVHVDAQGALAVLMIPVVQTALCVAAIVVTIAWQWRIR